jgi:hypothetical protein
MSQDEKILSKSVRTHVYRYLALLLLRWAVHLLGRRIFYGGDAVVLPLYERRPLINAAYIAIVNHSLFQGKPRRCGVVSFSFQIPFVTLWFAGFGMPTAWAIVFEYMMICLLFDRQIIQYSLIVTSILTTAHCWAHFPRITLEVSSGVYIVRLVILFAAGLLALYVNRYTGAGSLKM